MSTTTVHAGFIPLIDCAPLVIAHELGFAAANGIALELHREVSWANIRDKAEAGIFDCAIMLAPMPIASTLGLGGRDPVPMIAAMATSLNGNAITVSNALYEEMLAADRAAAEAGGMAAAKSLARVVAQRRANDAEPLTLGMVYPFSSHNYDLRYWLAAAGIDPVNDVNLVVVPPPLIAASLTAGRVDGFCVGEPWNSLAVSDGSGVIIATKAELWADSPEKVLAMRADYAAENAPLVQCLTRAIHQACAWLESGDNRRQAAEILSRPNYVGVTDEILLRSLHDQLVRGAGFTGQPAQDVIVFSKGGANFPWVSHAIWIVAQMIRWGQVRAPFDIFALAERVYRADLYRAAMDGLAVSTPQDALKTEGAGLFFGSDTFDPKEPLSYLEKLSVRDTTVDLSIFTERC